MWIKSKDTYQNYTEVVDFHITTMHTESNMSGNAIRRRYEVKKEKKKFDFSIKDLLGDSEFEFEDIGLVEALKRRRTSWEFGNDFSVNKLAKLLQLSLGVTLSVTYGENIVNKKSYASAGAEYVVKPYMITQNFGHKKLDDKVLEYDNQSEQFRVIDSTSRYKLNQICSMTKFTEQNLNKAKCTIFLVADLRVLFSKYGRISYRLAMLEAGHICQNLQLVASSMNLCSVPLGGFYDNYIKELLHMDKHQYCLYILAMG